jgi:hypothetical protein
MATLNRIVPLYINGDIPGGLEAALEGKTSQRVARKPQFMAYDCFELDLYFRKPGASAGTASTAYTLPAAWSLVFAAKLKGPPISGDVLFSCASWSETEPSGDDARYIGTLDLNTTAVAAALVANPTLNSIPILIDVEMRNALNSERLTWRIEAELIRQVYANEGAPSSGTPLMVYVTEELIGGNKVLIFRNSDSVEYMRLNPPGV